ncbi:MAG: DNA repair protein RadA [Capsulimonadaceae bacterium]|nr:DNA repair protein RadA [Capsulimonadaceae bacterium]
MAKASIRYVCRNCGAEFPKWLGRCPSCDEWGTLEEFVAPATSNRSAASSSPLPTFVPGSSGAPKRLADVPSPSQEGRASTGIGEFDRVLGGGIVPGSLVLIGGDPGIGKSTLLTQAAAYLSRNAGRTLYISGEESAPQIKRRAERLGVGASDDLLLQTETDVLLIESAIRQVQPSFVIIDSIQTMSHPDVESLPGSVWQVRAATASLARVAKGEGIPIFLVGHVTKEGSLAGPRVLEHMVDSVLTFEGDRHSFYRLLRATKNRFGSTDEIGIFEMRETGLVEVPNPSELLLSERPDGTPGSAVACVMEGSRPLLVEVQTLIAPSYLANPRRAVTGMELSRIQMLLAVLEKRVRLSMANQDVFVNIAGGVRIDEPGADLAVCLAAASQYRDIPVGAGVIAIGEVGLAGEVRAVGRIDTRLGEAARLGFTRAIIAKRNKSSLRGRGPDEMHIIGVDNIHEAIEAALRPNPARAEAG